MSVVEHEIIESPVEVLTEREQRARTLEAAALEIEVHGWQRNMGVGPTCLVGAIAKTFNWSHPHGCYGGAAFIWSGGPYEIDPMKLWYFNDHIAESAEDVTFLLRWRAAEIRDGL